MIEKLRSLKDKIEVDERKDLVRKERASRKRKEERGKRVREGRKLTRSKNK